MNTTIRKNMIKEMTSQYFGDAVQIFQHARLRILINGAHENTSASPIYSVQTLLSIHNETIDLIDIGNLLNEKNNKEKRNRKKMGL